jgi:hypothetical protein
MMSRFRLFLLLVGTISIGLSPLHAGVIFQFDELGDIQYSISGNPYVALTNGVVESDPTGGVGGHVLVYNLTPALDPFEMLNGDVPIGANSGLIGDLRFTDNFGDRTGEDTCGTVQCLMIFYVFDSLGKPADVGSVSTSFLTPQTARTVLGSGSFTYTPDDSLFFDGSIVAPEPAPVAMLTFGMAAFFFLHKRSKAK